MKQAFILLFIFMFTGATNVGSNSTQNVSWKDWAPALPMSPPPFIQEETTSIDIEESQCLALNIFFEAAVESTAGKLAVAHVTLNRVKSNNYPNSICEVVKEGIHHSNGLPKRDRCQFSWYCDGRDDVPRNGRSWESSQSIAKWFYDHQDRLMDITDGATHYHADWMEKYPKWAHKYRKNVRIDDHIFYKHSYRNKKKTNELTLARL